MSFLGFRGDTPHPVLFVEGRFTLGRCTLSRLIESVDLESVDSESVDLERRLLRRRRGQGQLQLQLGGQGQGLVFRLHSREAMTYGPRQRARGRRAGVPLFLSVEQQGRLEYGL